ncbi:MAG TPA: MerR family transcriptional regulator [Verrucomicrobiae bacterium]|nr:MerR family transcriptional regulator [Verrucomicrobiae bacterium]
MISRTPYTVGAVAKLANVTVRTLHHYHEAGVLRPTLRTESGYRMYSAADLERLQRILCYRQVGMGIAEIRTLLDAPADDPLAQLRRQHRLLTDRIEQLERMRQAVAKMMEARRMGLQLDPHEMVEVFGGDDPTGYAEEAERRWGETSAWAESQRRTAGYTKADWQRVRAEFDEICRRYAALMAAGAPAGGSEATAVAEAHRQHLERVYYPCTPQMHRGLADLTLTDRRFAAHYERYAAGLAAYVHEAIHANADGQSDE